MAASVRSRGTLLLLAGLVVLLFLLHVGIGVSAWYAPWRTVSEILRGPHDSIVWPLRLPRAVNAFLVGSTLGIVGSAFQAQFRNPLADPYIVGVSSGAAVGGVLSVIFGVELAGLGTTVFGIAGGLLSLALVMALARRRGQIDATNLLLSGVVIGAMLSALLSLAIYLSGSNKAMVFDWLLGSLTNALWGRTGVLAAGCFVGSVILLRETRRLNALAMGEEVATRLGVDVRRIRTLVLVVGTAMTAAVVGSVGIVGFVGLVSPHIARRVVGVDWRRSMLGAGLVGAGLTLAADILGSRGASELTRTPGMEIPIGVVTAILGAPALLVLLRRER